MAASAKPINEPAADRESHAAYHAFATSAANLERWHADGRTGPRPAGRLRRYNTPTLSPLTKAWATAAYRALYDPDGRPRSLRRRGQF